MPRLKIVITFNRIGGDIAARIFFPTVVDCIVAEKMSAELFVPDALIDVDDGLLPNVIADNLANFIERRRIDMKATRRSLAFYLQKTILRKAGSGFAATHGGTLQFSDESFIGLDDLAGATHRSWVEFAHCITNATRHEPRGLV